MKIRRIILVCCSLALLGAVAAHAEELLDGNPTAAGSVSIQLPKGWVNAAGPTGGNGPGGRTLLLATAPQRDKDATGEFQATFAITVDAAVQLNGAAQQALVAQGVPNYKAVEKPTAFEVNGIKGITFGGTFTNGANGALPLRSRQYMFVTNNELYVITFTSLNSRWAAYKGAMEASVATFAVVKK